MHGLGDNVHQRALVRAWIKRGFDVSLETAWPCIYHDLPIRFIQRPVALRAQLKNARREHAKFVPGPSPHHTTNAPHISYSRDRIERTPSKTFLEAMFQSVGLGDEYANADMSLPIPEMWAADADALITGWHTTKPILVYRPLVVRPEWRGSGIRNANVDQYAELIAMVRDSFFVVSIADLEPNREWIVGPRLIADATYHRGELPFDTMAAIMARAALIYTSSGFPAVLGPAVGTPTISIQGGFEPARWHADGARWAPYLGIDTKDPCVCSGACNKFCAKIIDMPPAKAALTEFIGKLGISLPLTHRSLSDIFAPSEHSVLQAAPRTVVRPPIRIGHPSLLARRYRNAKA
jgi:hypothetical protein